MAYDGSLKFDTKVDTKGFQQGLGAIGGKVKGLISLVGKFAALAGVAFSVGAIVNYAKASSAAYKSQVQDEQRLAQVMRNTISATNEEIQAVYELTSAQEKLGVVSGGVQLAGAQELGTYVTQTNSLEKLIPVMNDMLAQQYGFEASAESAINISTMLGKVLDGQTGALSRYGYSFTEAQEQILKYGSEAQRVATIVEVIGASVGGMNAALAKTDVGRQQQLANTLGDIQAQFGRAITQIQILFLPALQKVAGVLSVVANYARQVAQLLSEMFGGGAGSAEALAGANADVAASAGAAASAEGKVAEAVEDTEKAVKGLMGGFDELNVLQSEVGDGADGFDELSNSFGGADYSQKIGIDADVKISDNVRNAMESLKTAIQKAFEPLSKISFDNLSDSFSSLKNKLEPLALAIGGVLGWLYDKIFVPLATFTIESALPAFFELLGSAAEFLSAGLEAIMPLLTALWDNFFAPLASWTGDLLIDALGFISEKLSDLAGWTNENSALFENFADKAGQLAAAIWSVIEPILDVAWVFLKDLISDLIERFKPFTAAVVDFSAKLFEAVAVVIEFLDKIGFIKLVAKGFELALKQIKDIAMAVFDFILSKIEAALQALGGLLDFVTGVFTGDFGKAFDGLKSVFAGFVNDLAASINFVLDLISAALNALLAPVNMIITGINLIPGMNIPDINISIPHIPKLATGAVIPPNSEFLAILGDQKSGTNIEAPLETIKDAVRAVIAEKGTGGTVVANIYLGTKQFEQLIIDTISGETKKSNGRFGLA